MTIEQINYVADYTIVWVLGGLSLLFFAISIAILYFRIKHYLERPITLPLLLENNSRK